MRNWFVESSALSGELIYTVGRVNSPVEVGHGVRWSTRNPSSCDNDSASCAPCLRSRHGHIDGAWTGSGSAEVVAQEQEMAADEAPRIAARNAS